MMKNATLLLLLICCGISWSQYSVNKSVISESGGVSSSGSYQVKGTLGQSVTGESTSGSYNVKSGFWYGINSILEATLTTDSVTAVTSDGATFHGTITSDGGEDSFRRGFFYKEYDGSDNSDTDLSEEESGSYGTGSFSLPTTSLSPETQYTVSAFSENSGGIGMGDRIDFWSLSLEPGSHASMFALDSVLGPKSVRLEFTAASSITNADGYMIIARRNTLPTSLPIDGEGYELGDMIGQSKVVAIVDNTSEVMAVATGLAENSNYYFLLIPYNYNGSEWSTVNYLTSPVIPSANAATPIPTLTEWAMLALLMAMAGFGIFKLRQV